uniref:Uncharacterized protein n=1 Tax=Rhizophora mucronata TaxID=61149 RepID=A0A2P2JLJ3_RHIMU
MKVYLSIDTPLHRIKETKLIASKPYPHCAYPPIIAFQQPVSLSSMHLKMLSAALILPNLA